MMRLNQISNDRKILKREEIFIGKRINIQYLCKALAHEEVLDIPLLQELVNNFKRIVSKLCSNQVMNPIYCISSNQHSS